MAPKKSSEANRSKRKSMRTTIELKKELIAIHDNRIRNFPRSSCSQSFTAEAALKTHTKKHRPDSREKEDKCTEYPFCVHNRSHLVRHAEIPTKMSDACTVCGGEEFDQSSHCNRCMLIHNGDRPYTCSLCGKVFDQSSPYRIHMQRHTGEQPYSCKVCLQPFSNRSTLIRHLCLHRGEKPYTCNVCGKGFNLLPYRQMHMNLHKGEYPYTCTKCGKVFGHPDHFQKHMKIHSGE
uniref:C2H2-type domain-containing protein n=1 Tax=Eptatretus burgeri TaxID=7764 RepID=A0A8C4Q7G0_EPTBU